MNVTTSTFSLTQMILAWALLGLLLSWLIIFTALTLRVVVMKKAEWEDLSTPSRPFPAISTQNLDTQRQHVGVTARDMLPRGTNAETSTDVGSTSIK